MPPFDVDPTWYESYWDAPPRPRERERAEPAGPGLWRLTAGLAAWFIASSAVMVLLATGFGWLR
jgi:hypothetical protein